MNKRSRASQWAPQKAEEAKPRDVKLEVMKRRKMISYSTRFMVMIMFRD